MGVGGSADLRNRNSWFQRLLQGEKELLFCASPCALGLNESGD